jgi:hypothetical protein
VSYVQAYAQFAVSRSLKQPNGRAHILLEVRRNLLAWKKEDCTRIVQPCFVLVSVQPVHCVSLGGRHSSSEQRIAMKKPKTVIAN